MWARPSVTLEANRTTINEGQPLTLSWTSHNADRLILNPGNIDVTNDADRSRVVRPLEGRRTYTLTASNPGWTDGDSTTARVTVTVRPKPPGSISASPNPCTIPSGSNSCTTTISWEAQGTNATLVEVSHLTRAFASSGATGSQEAPWIQEAPAHTYIFYLYDYHDRVKGAQLDSVTVTGIRPPETPTVDIGASASSCQIAPGDTECSVRLSWSATNVARVRVRKGSTELANSTASSGRVDGTVTEGDNEFVAEGLDSGGAIVATDRVEVTGRPPTVQPPRIDSFTASPTSVDLGNESRLSWTTNGEEIVATISPDVGEVAEDGSTTVTPKEDRVTTGYTLTARNSGGQAEATASVTINPPTIRNCSASPTLIDLGGSARLSWNSSSARVSIDQGIGDVAEDGTQSVSPSTRTTYRLTATGSGGRRASCTATVKVRPRIDSFEADPSSITRGQSSTLRWTTTNASSVTLGGSGVDDDGSQVVIPYNTTRYTLTARNQDAQVSEQVTVTVTLPPAPVINNLYPSQGVPDSPVTIYGTNFGTDQGSVSFSGSSAEINSWGTTEVSVLVPRQLSWGTVWVSLTAYGQTSNSVRYEVTGDPVREECDEDEEDCPERDEEEGEEEGEDGEDPPPDP